MAVLGTGVDVPYPVGHRMLHRTIGDQGLVLSENPPGTRAGPGAFPKRNRIIAALAPVTIVVEARWTAIWQLGPEQGAVTGLITRATISNFPIDALQAVIG